MPKGTIRNPGTAKSAKARGNNMMGYSGQQGMNRYDYESTPQGAKRKAQKSAKIANEWNEEMRAHFGYGGHANKALRKSMQDVRSVASTGGALARIKENPVSALKRRAATKKK